MWPFIMNPKKRVIVRPEEVQVEPPLNEQRPMIPLANRKPKVEPAVQWPFIPTIKKVIKKIMKDRK